MKTLQADALSIESMKELKFQLNAYKNAVKTAINGATQRLMMDAEQFLRDMVIKAKDEKHERIHVTSKMDKNGRSFILSITGFGVGFLEFGTGAYTDESHEYADKAPFHVYKGSYSREVGNNTWDAWIQAGYSEESYPYNRYPVRPLYFTALWIETHWEKYYREEIRKVGIS